MSQHLHFFDKHVGLMSGRYTWYQVIVMVTAPCAVVGDGDCLHQFFTYFDKERFAKLNFVVMTNPELMSINMFNPTFVANLMTIS